MATWHVAGSLEQLLAQLNAHAPRRSTASDGSIGDAAHASRDSDHNPWWRDTVTARDFTHDPGGGCDGQWLADQLVRARDPRIKYLIWNRRICAGNAGPAPWVWRPYSGPNAHTHHVHVSVVADPACEDRRGWDLGGAPAGGGGSGGGGAVLRRGSTGAPVKALQARLNRDYPAYSKLAVDGDYGPGTEAVVREFQRRSGLAADGIAGPATLGRLGLA